MPWPTPSSAPKPCFFISASPRTSTFTPSLAQRLGAAGEFRRVKNIGRLIDQVAGQEDAVRHRVQIRHRRRLRRRHVGESRIAASSAVFLIFIQIAGAVFVEAVTSQTRAKGQMRRRFALS